MDSMMSIATDGGFACGLHGAHPPSGARAALARHQADPTVTGLVEELRDASPDFARLWERHDVQAPPTLAKTFHHPSSDRSSALSPTPPCGPPL
ncbi:hypothetical protein ABH926_005295 [Catenulispora sp. GP43]